MDEQALETGQAADRAKRARAGRRNRVSKRRCDGRARRSKPSPPLRAGSRQRCRIGSSEAVQEGLRREVLPVARNLGEIRGLLNNAIGRLERLEQELIAERNARLDDLTLLVDLISTGWKGVDRRLERIERGDDAADVVQLQAITSPPRRRR